MTALGAGLGLGPTGALVGLAYGTCLAVLLARALRSAGRVSPSPADHVTLVRALLVGGVTALVADGLVTGEPAVKTIVGLAAVALALDAVDGQVARRTGTASPLGARFDMEVDAFLIAVLSVQVALVAGWWVLAIGAMRYVFVLAGYVWPWLRGTLPPSYAAKTIAAVQGIVLTVAAAGLLPAAVAEAAVAVALALLTWSFGRDVPRLRALARVHHHPRNPQPRPAI
ncbi:CDP-alcohol phosphatidyltransferase family protein [Pseudonocardia sp.]|uniref:CDP-alcohol phosphatidyltransferase family protein n=1 Tax=Pseudonocardia sp. TaxID=60912 RepID=UPI003D142EB8